MESKQAETVMCRNKSKESLLEATVGNFPRLNLPHARIWVYLIHVSDAITQFLQCGERFLRH